MATMLFRGGDAAIGTANDVCVVSFDVYATEITNGGTYETVRISGTWENHDPVSRKVVDSIVHCCALTGDATIAS